MESATVSSHKRGAGVLPPGCAPPRPPGWDALCTEAAALQRDATGPSHAAEPPAGWRQVAEDAAALARAGGESPKPHGCVGDGWGPPPLSHISDRLRRFAPISRSNLSFGAFGAKGIFLWVLPWWVGGGVSTPQQDFLYSPAPMSTAFSPYLGVSRSEGRYTHKHLSLQLSCAQPISATEQLWRQWPV